jgi:hypothetical protein
VLGCKLATWRHGKPNWRRHGANCRAHAWVPTAGWCLHVRLRHKGRQLAHPSGGPAHSGGS